MQSVEEKHDLSIRLEEIKHISAQDFTLKRMIFDEKLMDKLKNPTHINKSWYR